jgi:signal transduction histidine kinase
MKTPRSNVPPLNYLFIILLLCLQVSFTSGQNTQLVQVKAFDEQLRPVKQIELAINNNKYFSTNNKGDAFVELAESDFPIRTVKLADKEMEASSWNYSKGTLEVIVRRKNYWMASFIVKGIDGNVVADLSVTIKGAKTAHAKTNEHGTFEIPLALSEKITTADQVSIANFNIVGISEEGHSTLITISPVQSSTLLAEGVLSNKDYFENFDFSKLDSIQSLTAFYAIFKNYQIRKLSAATRKKLDDKFFELVHKLEDTPRGPTQIFTGRISDSSFVADDITNLLSQATQESQVLDLQRADFDQQIQLINNKLANGIENLDSKTRAKLLDDIIALENILIENENRFYRNHNDYQEVINSLKDRFAQFEDLENKLLVSEAQRLRDQEVFRERLLISLGVAFVLVLFIVLLVYFSNYLRKQKMALLAANAEIKRINENLEALVDERTHALKVAHRELDTFLYRASHDLRSPVCSIIGLCNIASHFTQGESKDLLDKVVDTTSGMDRLLKKLSVISEINQPSNYSEIELYESIRKIENHFARFIEQKNIEFTIHCPKTLHFHTYPAVMDAVLTNLIENALLYTSLKDSRHRLVDVRVRISRTHLELSINDNGIGVSDEIKAKMFDMFFKGHVESKGNGLGLYVVQKSVQALNGEIKVDSKVGKFTKVIIRIPLSEKPVQGDASVMPPNEVEVLA